MRQRQLGGPSSTGLHSLSPGLQLDSIASCSPGEQPPWRDITPRRDGSNRGVTEGIFLHIAIRNQRSTMEVSENVNVINVLSNIHVKAVPWFIYFSLNSDIA